MPLKSTTYLITGASRGLGYETAVQLLAQSPQNRIVAAARNPDASEQLKQLAAKYTGRIEPVKLDLADAESIKVLFTKEATTSTDYKP